MKENELIRSAKNGDFTKLPEWIDLHSAKLMHFSFQYGLTEEEANEVTLDTYITLRNELIKLDEDYPLLLTLYKLLLKKLSRIQSTLPVSEDVFPFKEDSLLHIKIVEMNRAYKIAFILSYFHQLTSEQISYITNEAEDNVHANINTAHELLGVDEKSLNLLKKSYNRLPVKFRADQVYGAIKQPANSARKKSKSIAWTIIAVFLLAIILISTPILFPGQKEQRTVNASDMESFKTLEEKYKSERSNRQNLLQLEEARFNQLDFIRKADSDFQTLKQVIKDGAASVNMESETEMIIESLKLPSEMMIDIQLEPLYEDEAESIEFIRTYRGKVKDLITVYNGVIWDYRETIEEVSGGSQRAHSLMFSKDEFPDELQHMIVTMRDQSIQLCEKKHTFDINACYYKSSVHDQWLSYVHYSTRHYGEMLSYDYYLNHANMVYSPGWISSELDTIQQAIIALENNDDALYTDLESYFVFLLLELMKGKDFLEELEKGSFPTSYQQAWQNLSYYYHEEALPLIYLIQPIVEEMDQSNWQKSDSWEKLNHASILDAVEMARNGKLAEKMFGKRPTVVSEKINLPSDEFNAKVEALYADFSYKYDKAVFKYLSPIYAVAVYDYANEVEDPYAMLNLFDYGTGGLSEREWSEWATTYVAEWQKGISIFDEATTIEFSEEELEQHGRNFFANVFINKNQPSEQYVPVVVDSNGHISISGFVHTPLPSTVKIPETKTNEMESEWISYHYGYFKDSISHNDMAYLSPTMIIATYYYAAEQGDFDTQYALYVQDEKTNMISKEHYLDKVSRAPQEKFEDLFTSIAFEGMEQDEDGNWPGIATLVVNNPKSNEPQVKEINMMWTKFGWRVLYPVE